MEITIPQVELTKALELLSRVSTKNVTLPVLQCVKITADTHITLQATNLEITTSIPLIGTVIEPGVVAVPTQTLLQSVQFISQPEITLRAEEQVLQIETTSSNTSIKLFTADEFPSIHQLTGAGVLVQGATFAYGIKSVAFAASQTSIKPELGSVYIQQKKEQSLTFVATDSFRLMEKTVSQKGLILEQSLLIPQKNALEMARVCEVVDADPQLLVTDNQCALLFPNGTYIATRLITGNFPDYEQIIPKEYTTHVTVLKEDLQKSFKKTMIFLNKFRQVSLTVTSENLTVASQNNDIGHTTDSIKAQVTGDEIVLNFNQQYVMDPLQYIQDDSVKLSFAGIGRAMVVQGHADKSLRYLVMPMNK